MDAVLWSWGAVLRGMGPPSIGERGPMLPIHPTYSYMPVRQVTALPPHPTRGQASRWHCPLPGTHVGPDVSDLPVSRPPTTRPSPSSTLLLLTPALRISLLEGRLPPGTASVPPHPAAASLPSGSPRHSSRRGLLPPRLNQWAALAGRDWLEADFQAHRMCLKRGWAW